MSMAPHSSTLAWKIPWTEEPGRLQSIGLQRVGNDWACILYILRTQVGKEWNQVTWDFNCVELGTLSKTIKIRLTKQLFNYENWRDNYGTQASQVKQAPVSCKNRWLRCLCASLVVQRVKNLPAMQETQVYPLGWEDPWEKEMATHSSILAWRIPWTEEPGRLQSMGSQLDMTEWQTLSVWYRINLRYNRVHWVSICTILWTQNVI